MIMFFEYVNHWINFLKNKLSFFHGLSKNSPPESVIALLELPKIYLQIFVNVPLQIMKAK